MSLCHCGSHIEFDDCCGPVFSDARGMTAAENLMRARYYAFAERKIGFLGDSLHPDQRHDYDEAATNRWGLDSQWLDL